MEFEYTKFDDMHGTPLYRGSIVTNKNGGVFIINHDEVLGYVLYEVFDRTVEKLFPETALQLVKVSDDYQEAVKLL